MFTLSEDLESDVTLNLLQGGAAPYGTTDDWHLSVGGVDCEMAGVTNPCEVIITAGATTATATVNVNTDANVESTPETFTVSVLIDSGNTSIVTTGNSSTLNFTIEDVPPPTVQISYTGSTNVHETTDPSLTITLSEALQSNVTIDIVDNGSTATYGTSRTASDWAVFLIDGQPPCSSLALGSCRATITAGMTSFRVGVRIFSADGSPEPLETISFSISIADAGSTGLVLGSPTDLMINIDAH